MSAELLRLPLSWVANKEEAIVLHELVLDFSLGCLVNVFLVESHNATCNSLPDCVDLGDVTSTADLYADINLGEFLLANKEDWLKNLGPHDFRLDKVEGDTVNTDHPFAHSNSCNGDRVFLLTER
jgi:hypothetical protein